MLDAMLLPISTKICCAAELSTLLELPTGPIEQLPLARHAEFNSPKNEL